MSTRTRLFSIDPDDSIGINIHPNADLQRSRGKVRRQASENQFTPEKLNQRRKRRAKTPSPCTHIVFRQLMFTFEDANARCALIRICIGEDRIEGRLRGNGSITTDDRVHVSMNIFDSQTERYNVEEQ